MKRARLILPVLLFALITLVWVGVQGESTADLAGSVQSREQGGRRALAALLEALEFPTQVSSQAPGAFVGERSEGLLWLASAPVLALREEGPPAGHIHDPAHYRRFCESGGTLLLPLAGAESFLVETLGLTDFGGLEAAVRAGRDRDRARVAGGGTWDVELRGEAILAHPDPPLEALIALDGGGALALRGVVGNGQAIVLAADDALLANDRLALADHAPLAVELASVAAAGGPLRFDEYALGVWRPPGAGELALGPRLFWLSVGLILFALLAVWRSAWAGPFPRDSESTLALSPLVRARARAGLLERARRFDLLGDELLQGTLQRWAAAVRLPQRTRLDAPVLLEALAQRAGRGEDLGAWRAALFDRPVRTSTDLDRLSAELAQIEAVLRVSSTRRGETDR